MSTLVECNSVISHIIQILKLETKTLRAGRLDELESYSESKQRYALRLEELTAELMDKGMVTQVLPQMEHVQRLARENSLMLQSVLHAVKSAIERVSTLEGNESRVGAYHENGSTVLIQGSDSNQNKLV